MTNQLCLVVLCFATFAVGVFGIESTDFDLNKDLKDSNLKCFATKNQCDLECTDNGGLLWCQEFKSCNGNTAQRWSCQPDIAKILKTFGTVLIVIIVCCIIGAILCCVCVGVCIYCCVKKSNSRQQGQVLGGQPGTVQYTTHSQQAAFKA